MHSQKPAAGGGVEVLAKGLHKGKPVGFRVVIPRKWGAGEPIKDSPVVMQWGTLTLASAGAESDAFVAAVDEVYKTGLKPTAMKKEVSLSAVCLDGDPLKPDDGIVRIKCFAASGTKDEAEFFVNIDAPKGRVEFNEKDVEYRAGVVKALRK